MKKKYVIGLVTVSSMFLTAYTEKDSSNEETVLSTESSSSIDSRIIDDKKTSSTVDTINSSINESSIDSSNSMEEETVVVTEEMNKPMGSNSKYDSAGITSRATSTISATEGGRPAKNFIDISSWNGAISQEQYRIMRQYGVSGVVVKLTEHTTYQNPQRGIQVKNAQLEGIKVSAYHYSHFTNEKEAIAEANYFADTAIGMGLSKDTIMVNDAEEIKMNNGQATANSLAFSQQLKNRGFNNIVHYSMGSWFTGASPVLNTASLGVNNIWVAHYPYNPTADNLLYKDQGYSAWQWSSSLVFPSVSVGVGVFDINMDYLGRFTNGKVYDTIQERKQYNYSARILPKETSKNDGVYGDVFNTREGINYFGTGDQFAGQKVTVVGYAKTSRSTYLQFVVNGKTYWMDSRSFSPELDTATFKPINANAKIKSANESKAHGLYTLPNNTSTESEKLGVGSLYADQSVKIINSAVLSTGVIAYQFSLNDQIIGWLDSRAFVVYDVIEEKKASNYVANVQPIGVSKFHGVFDDVHNTRSGINYFGTGDQYAGRQTTIVGYAKTSRSTYLQFNMDGKSYWMDSRAFTAKLDTVVDSQNTNILSKVKPASESNKHGLYTKPNNTTIENEKIGLGSLYAEEIATITNVSKLSTGVIAYQFSINGEIIGWMDSRAFVEYDTIEERKAYNYIAIIKNSEVSKEHGVFNDIHNTKPGIIYLGTGEKFANRQVVITSYAKTSRSTYLQFSIDGQTVWMDSRAFTPKLDSVKINSMDEMKIIKPANESSKHGLYTKPNNTSIESEKIGLGSLYENKKVKVINKGMISTGVTAYQFSINGEIIGWMDSRAFKD